ncbi:purine and uridine phosphorylase [Cenococcum geophilum]
MAELDPKRYTAQATIYMLNNKHKGKFLFSLLVGVAARLPNFSRSLPLNIRLGDVLVSLPTEVLANTETVVRSAISSIKLMALNDIEAFLPYYKRIKDKEYAIGTFSDPGQDYDKLYKVKNDKNKDKYNVIGLKIEAASTINCVYDYRDKYKNKEW